MQTDLQRRRVLPILVAVLLLAIACTAIAPNYVTGNWAWSHIAALPETKNLHTIQKTGIELPGWTTIHQRVENISHKKWSLQALVPAPGSTALSSIDISPDQLESIHNNQVTLFLRPQTDANDEPLVEWIDIDAFFSHVQEWNTDKQQIVQFSGSDPQQETSISARYFRGWQRVQSEEGHRATYTYAVLQWYAWPTGGSPNIADWFWADQERQWRDRHRMPWIAVTLMIPIEPLGDIAPTQPVAETIAQTIQTALGSQLFIPPSS